MAHFSTGLGLAVLGGCILGAAAISSHRLGGEAFAQGTGGERRIVSAWVESVSNSPSGSLQTYAWHYAFRIWSDNTIEMRCVGLTSAYPSNPAQSNFVEPGQGNFLNWRTVDNGTTGFRPLTDVDMSGETDAGDISQVLLDFNTRSEDLPPPPIDCTINAPR
jgi:hypothetical protein